MIKKKWKSKGSTLKQKLISLIWVCTKLFSDEQPNPIFILFLYPLYSSNRKIDLYDCRRRLWYNQAINSPKDVVIALDMSGSMTGSHFTIAKLLVQSLIDTLQQVDIYFIFNF